MIARHWRGIARAAVADAYVEHLRRETFPALARFPGFLSASILRRAVPPGVEFVIVTNWESLESIHACAGSDPETAVVPAAVQAMMVEFDTRARHYQVEL